MGYTFRPAAREQTKPLVGIYGQSGSGKTMSGLLLARGFAGDRGRVGMIDTESGRGQLYSDVIPGGYEVLTIGEPFSPQAYIEAIRAAEEAKLDALVIDSASHEWEGIGGVLDMAAENEKKSGKPGLHCWKAPKLEHQRFVLKLLQSPLFVVVCLRAKYKSRQVKNERGKSEIVRDEHTSPIQAEDFVFELTVHAEIEPDHKLRVTKTSHPSLKAIFRDREMITIETGRALSEWARGGVAPRQEQPPARKSNRELLFDRARERMREGKFSEWIEKLNQAQREALTEIWPELQEIEADRQLAGEADLAMADEADVEQEAARYAAAKG
jgi:hypothetical protein